MNLKAEPATVLPARGGEDTEGGSEPKGEGRAGRVWRTAGRALRARDPGRLRSWGRLDGSIQVVSQRRGGIVP